MSASAGALILVSKQTPQDQDLNTIISEGYPFSTNLFKAVYRPYINFSTVPKKIFFKNDFNWGSQKVRVDLSSKNDGELMSKVCLAIKTPALTYTNANGCVLAFDDTQGGFTNSFGHALIERAEFEIDGQVVDNHYGLWMEVWTELTVEEGHRTGYYDLIGKETAGTGILGNAEFEEFYFIPLHYWFTRKYSYALPIAAIKTASVAINFYLRDFTEMFVFNSTGSLIDPNIARIEEAFLLVEYIFLDVAERKELVNNEHSYIVDYIQYNGGKDIFPSTTESTVEINFLNPIKSLFWVAIEKDSITNNDYFNFSRREQSALFTLKDREQYLIDQCKIIASNSDLTGGWLDEKYFRSFQSYIRFPTSPLKHIYSYSFSLMPKEIQPIGYINANVFDNDQLQLKLRFRDLPRRVIYNPVTCAIASDQTYASKDLEIHLFALTVNIFNVFKSGKAGMEFPI